MVINHINELYEKEVEDNKLLSEWVDKLASFILESCLGIAYIDDEQWNERKRAIVEDICIKDKWR